MNTTKHSGVCFQYAESGTCLFGSKCKYSHDTSAKESVSKASQKSKWSKKSQKVSSQGRTLAITHIDKFFEEYPDFKYDPAAPIWTEFNRMRDDFGWENGDYEMRDARRHFRSAMVQEFNRLYGTDKENLASWQKLCRTLNIKPVPEGLTECREDNQQVRQTHVNLVDLVDAPRTGEAVKIFPSLKKLQEYTINTGKYFPKRDAYAGGLLRYLLREIINLYAGNFKKRARV